MNGKGKHPGVVLHQVNARPFTFVLPLYFSLPLHLLCLFHLRALCLWQCRVPTVIPVVLPVPGGGNLFLILMVQWQAQGQIQTRWCHFSTAITVCNEEFT